MTIFGLLIVPLPYTMKRKLFTFISENPLIAKLQYGMKVRQHPHHNFTKLSDANDWIDYIHLHPDPVHR